jgi:hypothetical protein
MKYADYFAEPQCFSEGEIVLSIHYTREQAHEIIQDYYGIKFPIDQLKRETVRFSYPPEYLIGDYEPKENIWWLGATGKGIKAVWVYAR